MRALVATGGPRERLVELAEVPEPAPRADQAVVAVQAVSLNRGECRRLTVAEPGWICGWDLAGRIAVQAADGSGPPEGTEVVALRDEGAWAQRVAVDTSLLAPLPEALPVTVASTLPVAGLTALLALERGGPLLGRRVAVSGATGGVGRFALQLARMMGAHTTAIVSTPDRVQGLPDVDQVEVGFDGGTEPFDHVLESVGGSLLVGALTRIAPSGHVVSYGNSAQEPTTFDVTDFYRRNRACLSAFFLFAELAADPPGARHLERLVDLVARGDLTVDLTVERDWAQAAETVRSLLDREVPGKAVLTVT